MFEFNNILGAYIKSKIKYIFVMLASIGIFMIVFSLYALPLEAVYYAALLICVFMLIMAIMDFIGFYKKHIMLNKLKLSITLSDCVFPQPKDMIEFDYQELVKVLDQDRIKIINNKDQAYTDMIDYYTMWAHQIKTPIAAMRLILQSQKSTVNEELLDQLFKIEQYVEMVLQYLRMESMSADLVIQKYSLDHIVKQAIRKYSKSFIHKKIQLKFDSLDIYVLTDEKWLVFVVEQILSNALKYTVHGQISIYMDRSLPKTLVIEDTGIGIELADLPRIFEKGFTGYNGRLDKKSTGIGLYLCKRILDKLSHTIEIKSIVGKGTIIRIGLDTADIHIE